MQIDLIQIAVERKLTAYLHGKISLRKFKEWFVPFTWDLHLEAPNRLQDIVNGIKLVLDESSTDKCEEALLKKRLAHFVDSGENGVAAVPGTTIAHGERVPSATPSTAST